MLHEYVLDDRIWIGVATTSAALAAGGFLIARRRDLSPRVRAAGALNVFWGLWIAIMGSGHLTAITTKAALGTLRPSRRLWLLLAYGLTLAVPGLLLLRETAGVAREDNGARRRAVVLNVWLACLLVVPAAPLLILIAANVALLWPQRNRHPTPTTNAGN